MSATETKAAIHQLIEGIDDEQFLQAVYTILEKQAAPEPDFWLSLTDAEKQAIQKGTADAQAGRSKPYQDVLAKYQ